MKRNSQLLMFRHRKEVWHAFIDGLMLRHRKDAWYWIASAFIAVQGIAGAVYAFRHPDLTNTRVMLAIGEWAIPFRWLG